MAEMPKGTITIWAGSTESIPQGWQLCDGNEGRPHLTDDMGDYYVYVIKVVDNQTGQEWVPSVDQLLPLKKRPPPEKPEPKLKTRLELISELIEDEND